MTDKILCDLIISAFLHHYYSCRNCRYWEPEDKTSLWGKCPLKKGGKYYNSKAKTFMNYNTSSQRHEKCVKFDFSDEGYNKFMEECRTRARLYEDESTVL